MIYKNLLKLTISIDEIIRTLWSKFADIITILSSSKWKIFCKIFHEWKILINELVILNLFNNSVNLDLLYSKMVNIVKL